MDDPSKTEDPVLPQPAPAPPAVGPVDVATVSAAADATGPVTAGHPEGAASDKAPPKLPGGSEAHVVAAGPSPMPPPGLTGPRKVQGQPIPDASVTPLVHYYRAEISRSIAWRNRMDATTNWAIISATALISVAFSNPDMPHILIPFGGIMVLLLLCIEGRRYRFYDVWRSRTRLLEAHMLVPFLLPEHTLLQGNWREALAEDLIMPSYKMSFWKAAGSRLRRNYVWIFLILLGSWTMRIVLFTRPMTGFRDFYDALAVGPLPSWAVLAAVVLFHLALCFWMWSVGSAEDPDVLVYKRVRNRPGTAWTM